MRLNVSSGDKADTLSRSYFLQLMGDAPPDPMSTRTGMILAPSTSCGNPCFLRSSVALIMYLAGRNQRYGGIWRRYYYGVCLRRPRSPVIGQQVWLTA